MARAVFFDANGTLIELRESVGALYAKCARTHGVELPGWRLDDAFHRVVARADPMVFPGVGPDDARERETEWWRQIVRSTFLAADSTLRFANFEAFFADLFARFAGPEAWRVRPDGLALAEQAATLGLRIGVLSNFDHRLPMIFEALEIKAIFEIFSLPFECGTAKPEATAFRRAANRFALPCEACLYVGHDPRLDLEAARAAGMRPIDIGDSGAAATLRAHARAD